MEQLATAFVKVQQELKTVSKNAEGYGYNYLTLDKLINETRDILTSNGFCILQPMTEVNGLPAVKTILLHISGEFIEGVYPITAVTMKQCNDAQQMGAAITYARRYCLAAILNIAQEDADAATQSQPMQQQPGDQMRF